MNLEPYIRADMETLVKRAGDVGYQVIVTRKPIDLILYCPNCGTQHIDAPKPCTAMTCEQGCALPGPGDCLAWDNRPHRSHLCHTCGIVWRPADVTTNGVESIATVGKNDTWPAQHNDEITAAPARSKA